MKGLRILFWTLALLAAAGLAGCAPTPAPASTPTPETFTDPFAYCAAVGTTDEPGPQYAGPQVPDAVINGLKEALDMPEDGPPPEVFQQGTSWRCMNGEVYACFVGANLPCWAKADTDRTPSQAVAEFCRENSDADVIPMAVTGRETVYEWRCANGEPEIVRQFAEVDERGFIANIWYELTPE